MLTQQVREVMTINQEIEDKSSWVWLMSEQMVFPMQSDFANENHCEARRLKQCNDQHTDQTTFFGAYHHEFIYETHKGNSVMRSSKMRLKY